MSVCEAVSKSVHVSVSVFDCIFVNVYVSVIVCVSLSLSVGKCTCVCICVYVVYIRISTCMNGVCVCVFVRTYLKPAALGTFGALSLLMCYQHASLNSAASDIVHKAASCACCEEPLVPE